jgi:hypothetical protein
MSDSGMDATVVFGSFVSFVALSLFLFRRGSQSRQQRCVSASVKISAWSLQIS